MQPISDLPGYEEYLNGRPPSPRKVPVRDHKTRDAEFTSFTLNNEMVIPTSGSSWCFGTPRKKATTFPPQGFHYGPIKETPAERRLNEYENGLPWRLLVQQYEGA